MQKQSLVILLAIFIAAACKRTTNEEILKTNDGMEYVKLTPLKNQVENSDGAFKGYDITDPGINNISAMILQIPNDWKAQNSFTRIWNGSQPINQLYIKASSNNNQSSVEILPYTPYFYADGPTTRSLRETSRSMGMKQQYQAFELPPMEPLTYIKQYVLPRLQQNGISFQINNEQDLGSQQQFKNVATSRHAYIDGKLNDGRNIRVECGIIMSTSNMNGETYYNWSVFPSMMISSGDVNSCYDILKHIRKTVLYNPEWEQKCNQLARKGNSDNAAIAQKDFENVKSYREAVNNIHQGITNDRNNSTDRNNESFRDVIGGEAKFENPNTGERVCLDDNYKYHYTDAQGNYYGSKEPLDYKSMSWSEVNRLDTKEY